jgi:hypothetical protein
MSGSHGDLFSEIGKLVLEAQAGHGIDLDAKAEELAERYRPLGVTEAIIAKAITRSIGAISFSLARVTLGDRLEEEIGLELGAAGSASSRHGHNGNCHDGDHGHSGDGHNGHRHNGRGPDHSGDDESDLPALPKSIFPSGVRLAVLS